MILTNILEYGNPTFTVLDDDGVNQRVYSRLAHARAVARVNLSFGMARARELDKRYLNRIG